MIKFRLDFIFNATIIFLTLSTRSTDSFCEAYHLIQPSCLFEDLTMSFGFLISFLFDSSSSIGVGQNFGFWISNKFWIIPNFLDFQFPFPQKTTYLLLQVINTLMNMYTSRPFFFLKRDNTSKYVHILSLLTLQHYIIPSSMNTGMPT